MRHTSPSACIKQLYFPPVSLHRFSARHHAKSSTGLALRAAEFIFTEATHIGEAMMIRKELVTAHDKLL